MAYSPQLETYPRLITFAEAGEQLAVIMERLGHKNDKITKLVYLHVTEEQRKIFPDRFEQVMSS